MPPRLISILGPTASGKSAVAVAVAQALAGEVVSCDAMQVYRELDLGTAKPTLAEQGGIPHHLLDCVDWRTPFTVRDYLTLADSAIRAIRARGRQPILCGGTGLYAQALLAGLPLRPADPALNATVRAELAAGQRAALLAELRARDPETADRVADNDRRLARAVEILRLTGRPPAELGRDHQPPDYAGPVFILLPEAACNRARIVARTHAMLAAGWVAEVTRLTAAGLLASPTASQALGYRQIAAWVAAGTGDHAALAEQLIQLTARYAKRQRTWFRHQHPGATVLPVTASDTPATLARAVLSHLTGP